MVEQYKLYLAGGMGALVAAMIVGEGVRRARHIPTSHGSARWATYRHIKRSGLFGKQGVMLGRIGSQYLRYGGEGHTLLVGPTRKGKGVGPIICTLLTDRESCVVMDPKDGENLKVTRAWRETLGPVYVFQPYKAPETRIDVLKSIRIRTPKEFGDTQVISQSLTSPEKMEPESATSLHFREVASHLLTAVFLHVLYTSIRKSLAGAWAFMTQEHKSLAACLKTMTSTPHVSAGVHQAISSLTHMIANISGDRELSSVWSTACRPLVLYLDDYVAKSTDAVRLRLG